jgi:hypothetical protein
MCKKYDEVLDLYKDSAAVWRKEIEKPVLDFETDRILTKYGISSTAYRIPTTALNRTQSENIDYSSVRQELWTRASKLQQTLTESYYGR